MTQLRIGVLGAALVHDSGDLHQRLAVLHGGRVLTSADDAVVTMGLIDDVYRAADMPVRGES